MLNISSRRHCTLFAKKGVCTCDFAERRTTGEIVPNMRTSKIALITATVILTVATGCNGFFLSENDLDSVSISPTNVFLDPGVTLQFYVTGTTVGGDSVDESANATWTSSNAQVATIDSSGLLTAISSEGTVSATTVKVTAKGQSSSTNAVVTSAALSSLTVTPSTATIAAGYSRQLLATGTLSTNASVSITNYVTWSSSDTSVATVSSTGKVTAVTSGSVTITATATLVSGTLTSSTTIA